MKLTYALAIFSQLSKVLFMYLHISYCHEVIVWECINSGLDYWNGGIVEWLTGFFFLIIYDVSSL